MNDCGAFPAENLIADFESGEAVVAEAGGRKGVWRVEHNDNLQNVNQPRVEGDNEQERLNDALAKASQLSTVADGACGSDNAFNLKGENVGKPFRRPTGHNL